MTYYVYRIGDTSDNCYIGVTNNPESRWKNHQRSKFHVGKKIRTEGWTFVENFQILFTGSEKECFALESQLRPQPNMGLNEAAGGLGGHTSYTEQRNSKISQRLKGRAFSADHKIAISISRTGKYGRDKNPRAKIWTLIDPQGNKYTVNGALQPFCEEYNINWVALRHRLNSPVEAPSLKFRDRGNDQFRTRRMNTIGWTLLQE